MSNFEKALEAGRDRPLSEKAKAFIEKVYICESPCDSWGVCSNCYDKNNFLAGYNFGYDFTLKERAECERRGVQLTAALELEKELRRKLAKYKAALEQIAAVAAALAEPDSHKSKGV